MCVGEKNSEMGDLGLGVGCDGWLIVVEVKDLYFRKVRLVGLC